MRRLVLAAAVALLPQLAAAQQVQPDEITLRLKTQDVMLIVQTLGAIGCQNVTQLVVCQQAADMLREIKRQAGEQMK